MSIYDIMLSGQIPGPERTRALAGKLRGQEDRALLAMLSGDPVLSQVGQVQGNAARSNAAGFARMRQRMEDRASTERRHGETQDRLQQQFEAQQNATELAREEANRRHDENLALRRDTLEANIEHRELTRQLMEQKEQAKLSKQNNDNARRLSAKLVDEGVTDLEASIEQADQVVSKYFDPNTGERREGVDDIPGYGGLDNARPTLLLSQEGKEMRTFLASVRNKILKARSGAAVTNPEMARLSEELGTALGGTEEQMIQAYVKLRKELGKVKSGIMAGYSPEVVDLYQSQFAEGRGVIGEMLPGDRASTPGNVTSRGTTVKIIP